MEKGLILWWTKTKTLTCQDRDNLQIVHLSHYICLEI